MRPLASKNYSIGQIVNSNLKILKLDHKIIKTGKVSQRYSLVQCLLCNSEKEILTFQIAQDKSCKCRNYVNKIYSKKKMFWSYKKGAVGRKLIFEISYEEFCYLTSQLCYYCGSSGITFINKDCVNRNINLNNMCNGIDRLNNKNGYVMGNIVPCCKICNRAKNNLSAEEFKKYIQDLVSFHIKRLKGDLITWL